MLVFRKLFFSKPIFTLVGLVLLCLQKVNAQEIWLQRSDGKVISSFDTLVEQSFFEKHTFTLKRIRPFGESARFICFLVDSGGPIRKRYTQSTTNVFTANEFQYLTQAGYGAKVHISVTEEAEDNPEKLNQEGLSFTLIGKPKRTPKPKHTPNQKIWLENYAHKKITEKDSIITPEFWKSKKVLIKTAVPLGGEDKIWCIINPEIGEARAFSLTTELWSKEMIEALDNAPHGTRLQVLPQVVDKANQPLPKQLNLRIVK